MFKRLVVTAVILLIGFESAKGNTKNYEEALSVIAVDALGSTVGDGLKTAAADRVSQYDFDRDGKVSFEDVNRFCSVTRSLFDIADKNDDGFLSNSEMTNARRYLFLRCAELPK